MAELQMRGMDELLERLQGMETKMSNKLKGAVLIKAAQPILADAIGTNVFKDQSGKGRAGLKTGRPAFKGDKVTVLIGIDKGDISEIFYMKMVEWGTSKMPARPFLTKAFERNKAEAYEILKAELRSGLGL